MSTDVTEAEVKPAVEFMQKEAAESLRENSDWAGAMTATTLNGVPTFLQTEEALKTITAADVQAFMKEVLAQEQYRVIVLDPEK